MTHAVALEDIFTLASQLDATDKARLIAQLAAELATAAPPRASKPLLGLVADLDPTPSAVEIDESRHEMVGDSH